MFSFSATLYAMLQKKRAEQKKILFYFDKNKKYVIFASNNIRYFLLIFCFLHFN